MNIQIGDRVETNDGKYHGTVSSLNRDADGIPCALLSGGNCDGHLESDCIFPVSSLRITQFKTGLPLDKTNSQKLEWQSMDISSGLGIGGIGSDDYNIHTETDSFAPQFSKRKPSGQLWQPCDRRGCDNEPVCLDCEYCDDHCHCGE